ncbi:O-methylsterigmatocystin oxidoreductase [Rhizoctonia solani 123E]|uniref:O-methylsterigmatocystin oxidoreductase n=1 Tax=Rhizoctonia solani 123E TaxID=1423351 RepID=A0A074RXV7_9AGAM|nr:O-methylsterigmatocystin oxidoreductase [Rhizoctonia solani 123E]
MNLNEKFDVIFIVSVSFGLILFRSLWYRFGRSRKLRHPPSPLSLPIVGNLFSMPPGTEHIAYMKLGQQLNSDIIYLKMLGQSIIVLNSSQAASDLFEKRSAKYSDRTTSPMISDPTLLDWPGHPGLVGYNDLWRSHRRMLNNWLNARAALQFHESHERHTRVLLKRLLNVLHKEHPFEAVENEFFLAMASSMFRSAYGYRIQGHDDPFFRGATEAIEHLFSAHMYTNFWVNILPALSYVPDWVPGTGWKRTAKEWREQKNWTLNSTLQWTKDRVAEGSAEPSILGALLDHKLTSNWTQEDKEYRLKELGLVLFSGGTDTSSNVLVKFVAAMVLNPKVQAKAQEEIDRVLGSFKLPTIADEERLPYVRNLILETLRWHPVLPTAVPHVCYEDDVYRGYDIPKGTVLAMSRDESIYKDPEVFNPDRFLDPKVPPLPGFGWGRRKCPGVYYARAAVFLSISSLLATFTFSKKIDSDGREVTPTIEDGSNSMTLYVNPTFTKLPYFTECGTSGLKPFEFQFKPRSDRHKQLIAEMSSTSE